jgi:hypothetical protein
MPEMITIIIIYDKIVVSMKAASKIIRDGIPSTLQKQALAVQPITHVAFADNGPEAKDGGSAIRTSPRCGRNCGGELVQILCSQVPCPPQMSILYDNLVGESILSRMDTQ